MPPFTGAGNAGPRCRNMRAEEQFCCASRGARGAAAPVEVLLGAIGRQALGPVEGRCPETGTQDRQERLQSALS